MDGNRIPERGRGGSARAGGPGKLVEARKAGASPWDLHQRAQAGEVRAIKGVRSSDKLLKSGGDPSAKSWSPSGGLLYTIRKLGGEYGNPG